MKEEGMAIIVSIRTGLASQQDSIMRRVPADYDTRRIADAIDYALDDDIQKNERSLAESVRQELDSNGSVIMVNGKAAQLHDKISKEMIWQDGDKRYYPKGVTDPDYCVLKFTAQNGRYYNNFKSENFEVN